MPNAADTYQPDLAQPSPNRVIIFNPPPDYDIISMSASFIRLHEQGHDVHVAYQTSGNIAVSDDEAARYIDFAADFNRRDQGGDKNRAVDNAGQFDASQYEIAREFLKQQKHGEMDTTAVRRVKGMIRRRKESVRATGRK